MVPGPLSGLCFDNFFLLLLEWAWLMLSSVGGGWFVLLVSHVTVFWTCPWITTLVLLLLYAGYLFLAFLVEDLYASVGFLDVWLLSLHEGCSCYLYVGSCSLSFIVCLMPYGFCC